MSDSTHTVTVRAFDSAYPGSMFDKPHGEYIERGDASSLAAALLELVSKHKRDAEDFEDALKQEKAERDALRAEFERLAAQAEPAPAPVGEYPAKALEVVEPVACLVNADLGAMVWPISDIGEAGTYCDEGEFPELLYPAATVSALQARIATQAEHQTKALEGVQAFEFDPPPYNSAAMGCGLEDRGVTDIYDAMYYGWHEAMDRAYESIPDDLVSASAVSALRERIAELESELRRVTTSPPTGSAPCARLCEHMAFQIQAKSDARRIAELEQDAVRGEPVITDQDMKGVCDEVAKK